MSYETEATQTTSELNFLQRAAALGGRVLDFASEIYAHGRAHSTAVLAVSTAAIGGGVAAESLFDASVAKATDPYPFSKCVADGIDRGDAMFSFKDTPTPLYYLYHADSLDGCPKYMSKVKFFEEVEGASRRSYYRNTPILEYDGKSYVDTYNNPIQELSDLSSCLPNGQARIRATDTLTILENQVTGEQFIREARFQLETTQPDAKCLPNVVDHGTAMDLSTSKDLYGFIANPNNRYSRYFYPLENSTNSATKSYKMLIEGSQLAIGGKDMAFEIEDKSSKNRNVTVIAATEGLKKVWKEKLKAGTPHSRYFSLKFPLIHSNADHVERTFTVRVYGPKHHLIGTNKTTVEEPVFDIS